MNKIELAKSARSKCRTCKEKIDKGIARLGVEYEFPMGERTVKGLRWHHLNCVAEKHPEEFNTLEIPEDLLEEDLILIKMMQEKLSRSNFSIKPLSEVSDEGKIVNISATIIKAMPSRNMFNQKGVEELGVTIYTESEGVKRKIILWGEHVNNSYSKGDNIFIINGLSEIGSNDQIQINATKSSKVLKNPNNDELDSISVKIEFYNSEDWDKPSGTYSKFEYAKTGRATCVVCENQIDKGEFKLIKPVWAENEKTKQNYPSNRSYHILCSLQDENGEEILHESITRLTPELVIENNELLHSLLEKIKEGIHQRILQELLDQ